MAENDGRDPRAACVALGRRLRAQRTKRGVSQRVLARRTGVNRTTIITLEHGEADAGYTTILRLAHGLGVKPGELVEDPDATEGEE
jgi:transcriptional regulator with XRE-family HTH domain